MKSHEFIQAAANMLAAMGGGSQGEPQADITVSGKLQPAEPETGEGDDINTQSMVAPLQQKLELLKKAVDVDNMYDNPERAGNDQQDTGDEVNDMKRLAGIVFNAEEDTDGLEG